MTDKKGKGRKKKTESMNSEYTIITCDSFINLWESYTIKKILKVFQIIRAFQKLKIVIQYVTLLGFFSHFSNRGLW